MRRNHGTNRKSRTMIPLLILTLNIINNVSTLAFQNMAFSSTIKQDRFGIDHSMISTSKWNAYPMRKKDYSTRYRHRLRLAGGSVSDIDPPLSGESFLRQLAERFQGDFDNYDQVVTDRNDGLTSPELGGHENMHGTLVPINSKELARRLGMDGDAVRFLIAAYYFDGMPRRIFRIRLYSLHVDEECVEPAIRLQIYLLGPEVEGLLRGISDRPTEWEENLLRVTADHGDGTVKPPTATRFERLEECDVVWKIQPDPIRHAYLISSPPKDSSQSACDAFHAVMENEEAVIDSNIKPGTQIKVKDELSLWENELWINDRGFDPLTGDFIYGNRLSVPYKLKRVCRFRWDGGPVREVVADELAWTLGGDFRSQEEYEENMERIGGVSTRFNAPPSPVKK